MTTKQVKFLSELLQCRTIKEAYEKVGISHGTAYRWMHDDEEFKKALNKRKTDLLNDVSIAMQVGFSDAVEELLHIIRNERVSAQVKVNAIDCLFRNAKPIIEEVDILNRLQEVEAKIQEEGEAVDS